MDKGLYDLRITMESKLMMGTTWWATNESVLNKCKAIRQTDSCHVEHVYVNMLQEADIIEYGSTLYVGMARKKWRKRVRQNSH